MPVTGFFSTINPFTSLREDFSLTWNAMRFLYGVHCPIMLERCGGGDVDCAKAHGNMDVAYQAVIAARDAYRAVQEKPDYTIAEADEAAKKAALGVFYQARIDELIFLRNGTQSATVVLAYMIAHNFVSYEDTNKKK